MELKKLKSGTDIRGVALEGYGNPVELTDEVVTSIVDAFVYFLKEKFGAKSELKVAVGHDSRLSSEHIKELTISSLKKGGTEIYDCSLASTPAVFMMTKHADILCDGAIMITASHLPKDKNGFKFFTKFGGAESSDIDKIIEYAKAKKAVDGSKTILHKKDFMTPYCDSLVELVRAKTGSARPLEGLKVVVDAGNGVGGFYTERVLAPLGANTDGSQFLNPDGNFPNHAPNPEDKTAMASISKCVINSSADLGIIFDTDVDRAAIVAGGGSEINRNKLIALISAIVLEETPNAYIVTDSVTSDGLRKFIEKKGGYHYRFKRGYKNVINEAIQLNTEGKNAALAIETSGHAAFKENYFLDDGAYLITKILIKMAKLKEEGKDLTSLISDLEIPKEEAEARIGFNVADWKNYGEKVIENLKSFSKESFVLELSTFEGVRTVVDFVGGWFLARMSVHDPVMVINIESSKVGGVKTIAKIIYAYLSSFRDLETSALRRLTEM